MYNVRCTMSPSTVNCQLSIVNYQLSTKRSDNSYNSLTPKKLSTCETLVINKNVVHYNLPDEQQSAVENYIGVNGYPTYKLIDRNGTLLDVNADPIDLDALAGLLERMK